MTSNPITFLVRIVLVVSLVGFAAFYVINSTHWPLVEDAPVMHYIDFLMAHGMRPYSDITDNNMPGAYLTEGWAMDLFGGGDLAWRIYDFALLITLGSALVMIARPYDWLAGWLAWGMFLLVHAADGPRYTGQREEVIAVLLIVACAALFEAVRRNTPWPAFLFGFCTALAASIKPTFLPLPVALLALTAFTLRRRRLRFAPIFLWAAAGMAVLTTIVFAFLLREHAVKNFLFILRVITPAYRAVWPASTFTLIVRAYPLLLLPVLLLALFLAAKSQPQASQPQWLRTWEQAALLVAAFLGLASYYIQHKGFYHHRYTWIAFCFLLCALQLTQALQSKGWRRHVAWSAFLFVALVGVPFYAHLTTRFSRGQDATLALQQGLETALEQDLTTLAAGDDHKLQRQILCFDLVSGCLSALYHLRLVESAGFTGDLLFFRQPASASTLFYRQLFWQRAQQSPPNLLIITTEWFGEPDSFTKLDTWPEFAHDVQTDYIQIAARRLSISIGQNPSDLPIARAYRIYLRKGSGLLLPPLPQTNEPIKFSPFTRSVRPIASRFADAIDFRPCAA